jgi:hypothetical protein
VTVESSAASELLHKARWWVDPVEFHERMRSDPAWVAAVRFACEHGIPISVFFGRVVEPGEPLWLPDDTEVAIGFEQWVAAVCPNCGLHRLDWEHEHDETFKGRIETCFGCVELADTRRSIGIWRFGSTSCRGPNRSGICSKRTNAARSTAPNLPRP